MNSLSEHLSHYALRGQLLKLVYAAQPLQAVSENVLVTFFEMSIWWRHATGEFKISATSSFRSSFKEPNQGKQELQLSSDFKWIMASVKWSDIRKTNSKVSLHLTKTSFSLDKKTAFPLNHFFLKIEDSRLWSPHQKFMLWFSSCKFSKIFFS